MLRIISKEAGVRGLACVTTELVAEAARRHHTLPVATAVLGYGLTAGALLGGLLKVQQRVALRVSGSGPIKKLVVESDSYGRVRGYVTPVDVWSPLPIGREEVRAAVGDQGLLSVVKDLRVKDLYEGVVPLQSGLLDVDLTYSLMMSEQTPSVVEIGVELDRVGQITIAGGLLLQTLPARMPAFCACSLSGWTICRRLVKCWLAGRRRDRSLLRSSPAQSTRFSRLIHWSFVAHVLANVPRWR
jgi:molecular chaperone Hsp33